MKQSMPLLLAIRSTPLALATAARHSNADLRDWHQRAMVHRSSSCARRKPVRGVSRDAAVTASAGRSDHPLRSGRRVSLFLARAMSYDPCLRLARDWTTVWMPWPGAVLSSMPGVPALPVKTNPGTPAIAFRYRSRTMRGSASLAHRTPLAVPASVRARRDDLRKAAGITKAYSDSSPLARRQSGGRRESDAQAITQVPLTRRSFEEHKFSVLD